MSAAPRITLAELIGLAQDCAGGLPADEQIEIIHRGADGEARAKARFRGREPVRPSAPSKPLVKLNKTQQKIIQAIGADKDLTAEEVCDRTGHADGGWFRDVLADMRLAGILTGEKGEPGYSVAMHYRPG